MAKVAILGVSGMLGSMVYREFKASGHDVVGTTRRELDASAATPEQIRAAVRGCAYVVNCIGVIKPHIRDDNAAEVRQAIEVNALFPHRLAACDAHVIQIATDCVYDGAKGAYSETDPHNALDVYGKTKSLGEVRADNFTNLRCSIVGFEEREPKVSLLEWFLSQPQGGAVGGYANHLWNGVTTLAFARLCLGIVDGGSRPSGLRHVLASGVVSKAAMLREIAEIFGRPDIEIKPTQAAQAIDRSLATLNPPGNEKLWRAAGYASVPSVRDMLAELKQYGRRA
ncbi:NAD(P)-dependent oxidoreductase [Alphaproteobacteria bacterium]|nr:NAD(P)-dependent oxidoreductase [Alphaproteobacteria bacterium]